MIAGIAPDIGVMLAARAVLGIGVGGFWVFGARGGDQPGERAGRGTAMAVVSTVHERIILTLS